MVRARAMFIFSFLLGLGVIAFGLLCLIVAVYSIVTGNLLVGVALYAPLGAACLYFVRSLFKEERENWEFAKDQDADQRQRATRDSDRSGLLSREATLNATIATLAKERDTLGTELRSLTGVIANERATAAATAAKLSDTIREADGLRQSLLGEQAVKEQLSNQLESLQGTVSVARAATDRLMRQIETLQQEARTRVSQIDKLNADVLRLRDELAAARRAQAAATEPSDNDDIGWALHVLGITRSSFQSWSPRQRVAIFRAMYLTRAKFEHPDTYGPDSSVKQRATERMRDLNRALEILKAAYQPKKEHS